MSDIPSRKTFHMRLEKMVDAIREDIVTGAWKEGAYLPSEKEFATRYQMSNKSVRQGLEVLVAEGLIEKIPRVGNKVLGQSRKENITLKFGCFPSLFQEAAMKTLLDEFHKLYPLIQVEVLSIIPGISALEKFRKSLDSSVVDVITMNLDSYDYFKEHDYFDSLETLTPNPQIYPFLTEAMTHNGELKIQPLIFSPLILCYNKDHFREKHEMEPDSGWHWNQLFECASRLGIENERLGFYFHLPSRNRWPIFLLQSGFQFNSSESGESSIGRTQLMNGLKACRELIYMDNRFPHFISEKDTDAEDLFFNEKTSMIMTTYFSLNHYQRQKSFDYDIAPLPYSNEPRTMLLTIGLAINSHSEMKESAKLFVDFLSSYKAQLIIRQKTLSIPTLKPAAEWSGTESIYRPSRYHCYREIIPTFRLLSSLNMTFDELHLFYMEAKLYWSGLETVEIVAERLEQLLSRKTITSRVNR